MSQDTIYDMVNEKISGLLDKGIIPWKQPWNNTINNSFPVNTISKKEYNGINSFMLSAMQIAEGFQSNKWLSFKQIQQLKGTLKKGSKGTPVIFWNWIESKEDEKKKIPFLKYYTVFNLSQTDIKDEDIKDIPRIEFNPIEACEQIVNNYNNKPIINNISSNRACYNQLFDTVTMPEPTQFQSNEKYYSTLFHELVHSTGHKSRLDRFTEQKNHNFGSSDYGKEELIAEMGNSYLCTIAQIDNTLEDNAAYIQSWLRAIKQDRKLLVMAAAKAQKAVNYILNKKSEKE